MDPAVSSWTMKLLDYGVLGFAVLICGYLVYRMGRFIVEKFEKSQSDCEARSAVLVARLDETQKKVEAISGGLAVDMQKTAAAGNAAQERIADLGDRFMRYMEDETRQYRRSESNRSGEHRA